MGRSKKWIKGLTPDQPVTAAARRALGERLRAVWSCAPLAAKQADESSKYVHELRVATRRARAALQVFADLLPKRKTQRMQKMLRRLRQAAGNARDLDVLGERFEKIQKEKQDSELSTIIEQIAVRRRRAQQPLVATYKRAKRKGFKRRSRTLINSVRWHKKQPEPTFAAAARGRLATLVDDFFTAAEADLVGIESLHQLRISGKRLRYAMELLASAFDDSFRGELYSTFEEVQEKLGTINDHATAITTIGEWLEQDDHDSTRAELAELIRFEEQQLALSCEAFRDWWTAERASALKRTFAEVLRNSTLSDAEEAIE